MTTVSVEDIINTLNNNKHNVRKDNNIKMVFILRNNNKHDKSIKVVTNNTKNANNNYDNNKNDSKVCDINMDDSGIYTINIKINNKSFCNIIGITVGKYDNNHKKLQNIKLPLMSSLK